MPVELRKRVAKAPPPAPEPPKKKAVKAKPAPKAADKAAEKATEKAADKPAEKADKPAAAPKKDAAEAKPAAKTNGSASNKKPAVGDTVALATFGGEVLLNDGTTTTLAALAEASTAGVVLFTYPKASTPGCTTQACLFRDAYTELTAATGFAIFGLSRDSPKSNTTFQTKQNLPYGLLCDAKAGLIGAIGLAKAPSGTQRGVFVVDKAGKVLVAEAGGPAATLAAVQKLVVEKEGVNGGGEEAKEEKKEEVEKEADEKADEVEKKEEKKEEANGGATEEDKEVEKAEAEGI